MRRASLLCGLTLVALASNGAAAAVPISAAQLAEQCTAVDHRPDSPDASACRAYVEGFLHGAASAQRAHATTDSWTDRARRTRLGSRAHRAHCLPRSTLPDDMIGQLLAMAPDAPLLALPVDEAMAALLRRHSPCQGRPMRGRNAPSP